MIKSDKLKLKKLFKFTELQLLDGYRKSLEEVVRYLQFEISEIIEECKFYSYDRDACETYCTQPKLQDKWRKKDFEPSKDCINCKFYEKAKK
jgi:hypothetical protein